MPFFISGEPLDARDIAVTATFTQTLLLNDASQETNEYK